MSPLKCPKCKGTIHYHNNEVTDGLSRYNPHWGCMLCGWIGYETEKRCPNCEKQGETRTLVLSKSRYYCLACYKMIPTVVDNSELIKSLPISEAVSKKREDRVIRQCPRCKDILFISVHKATKIGEENKTLLVCRNKTCPWKGIETEKRCRRCKKKLALDKNSLHCVYCSCCLATADEFLEEKEKHKDVLDKT